MGQTTFTGPVVSQNGFIENSFTTAQLLALPNPTEGLLVYNTTLNEYQVYNGSSFQPAFGPVGPLPSIINVNNLGAFAYGTSIAEVIIDLSGSYASSITQVTVQGMGTGFSVYGPNQIKIDTIPSGSVGNAPIIVYTSAGASSPWTNFELVNAPVITQIAPSSASNAGGSTISMWGYGFTNTNNIQFLPGGGTITQNTPTVYVDNYLTVTLPANGGTGATQVRGQNTLTLTGPWANGLFTYTAATPSFTLGNIIVSQGNNIAAAGNIANNQSTGTKMLWANGNALYAIDFAGQSGPWDPNGTIAAPTYQYSFGGQTGTTENYGFTLNGQFYVSWDYFGNQLWGYRPNNGPWDWTGGASLEGPVSVPSFAANFSDQASFTLDYNGNKMYISNNTAIRQYNLPNQYNISFVNNGADDIYDTSVDGIFTTIKATQWNNAGTHFYLLNDAGQIWRYTASTPWVVSTFNSPVQLIDLNASSVTSVIGNPTFSFHSAGLAVKADTENRILVYVHTNFNGSPVENFLCSFNA